MEPPAYVKLLVAPFARELLARELPGLPGERLERLLPFVYRRVDGMPSITRLGVLLVAAGVRALMAVPVLGPLVPGLLSDHPLPLVGEYARLVRSLGFAFVFEEWPDSASDGSARHAPAAVGA